MLEAAEAIAKKVVPLAQKAAPAQFAPYVPEQTKTLVQISGATQILGGLAFATGIGRRLGAGLLALTAIPHVIVAAKAAFAAAPDDKSSTRSILLRNIALLGATVLAANDTEGKPGLGWRAEDTSKRISKTVDKKTRAISKDAEKLSRKAHKELRGARKQLEAVLPN